jgi:uncharacterized protein (TIGR01244 family)
MKKMKSLMVMFVMMMPAAAMAQDEFGILNAHEPEEGVVFGGQPTAEQLEALAAAGFKSIIDLRGEAEDRGFDEASRVGELGLEYIALPVTGETLASPETFDRFLEIYEQAEKPALVHCASGNRVGAMYYAHLVAVKGMSRDEALELAKANGLRSMALVEPVDSYLDGR